VSYTFTSSVLEGMACLSNIFAAFMCYVVYAVHAWSDAQLLCSLLILFEVISAECRVGN